MVKPVTLCHVRLGLISLDQTETRASLRHSTSWTPTSQTRTWRQYRPSAMSYRTTIGYFSVLCSVVTCKLSAAYTQALRFGTITLWSSPLPWNQQILRHYQRINIACSRCTVGTYSNSTSHDLVQATCCIVSSAGSSFNPLTPTVAIWVVICYFWHPMTMTFVGDQLAVGGQIGWSHAEQWQVDQGGHLEIHQPSNQKPVQLLLL